MKLLVVAVCLLSLSFEGISGSVIKNVEVTLEHLKQETIKELEELVEPINKGVEKLEIRLEEYRMREAEIEGLSIDFSACTDLAKTVEGAATLARNISTTAYGIITNVTNSFNMLSNNCSSWNPIHAVECYVTNINVIRDDITRVKPLIQLYEKLVMDLVAKVEDQFLTCVGDKVPSTNAPTQIPTDKPTEKPSDKPTNKPTDTPTEKPSDKPTEKPSDKPTKPSSNNTTPKPVTTKKPWWHFW